MPNLTTVTLTNGIPTAGTGTVSTIDALLAQLSLLYTTAQAIGVGAQLVTLPTDVPVPSIGYQVLVATDIARQANTTAYAANQAWADSSSAPTAGGFTLTSAGRASGGSGVITDLAIISSNNPATLLQGELWIFDSSVTAINDLAAFSVSSADIKKLIGMVPFTLVSVGAGSGGATKGSALNVQNVNLGFTCSGTANLRYLVNVKNAYTPASAEVLTVRAKIIQTN
jgi:hypothetical protein